MPLARWSQNYPDSYFCGHCPELFFATSEDAIAHNALIRSSADFDTETHVYKHSKITENDLYLCSYCGWIGVSVTALLAHQAKTCPTLFPSYSPDTEIPLFHRLLDRDLRSVLDKTTDANSLLEAMKGKMGGLNPHTDPVWKREHRCTEKACRARFFTFLQLRQHIAVMRESVDFTSHTHLPKGKKFLLDKSKPGLSCSYCESKFDKLSNLEFHQAYWCMSFAPSVLDLSWEAALNAAHLKNSDTVVKFVLERTTFTEPPPETPMEQPPRGRTRRRKTIQMPNKPKTKENVSSDPVESVHNHSVPDMEESTRMEQAKSANIALVSYKELSKMMHGLPPEKLDRGRNKCDVCSCRFPTRVELSNHYTLMYRSLDFDEKTHKPSNESGSTFNCSYCGAKFRKERGLELHQTNQCKSFQKSAEADTVSAGGQPHQEEHRGLVAQSVLPESVEGGRYTCPECTANFPDEVELYKHSQVVKSSKDFIPQSHFYRNHSLVGRFQCGYCNKKFSNVRGLERHQYDRCANFSANTVSSSGDERQEEGGDAEVSGEGAVQEKKGTEEEGTSEKGKEDEESGGSREVQQKSSPPDPDNSGSSGAKRSAESADQEITRSSKKVKLPQPATGDAASNTFSCDICPYDFLSRDDLQAHHVLMKESKDFGEDHEYSGGTKTGGNRGGESYGCSYCPEEFSSVDHLMEHQLDLCAGFSCSGSNLPPTFIVSD